MLFIQKFRENHKLHRRKIKSSTARNFKNNNKKPQIQKVANTIHRESYLYIKEKQKTKNKNKNKTEFSQFNITNPKMRNCHLSLLNPLPNLAKKKHNARSA